MCLKQEDFNLMCEEANDFRKKEEFDKAIDIYNELVKYIELNALDLNEYQNLNAYAGLANCLRTKYKKNFKGITDYKNKALMKKMEQQKFICAEKAIKFINGAIINHKNIDFINKDNWFKTELIWSYLGYYLSPEYEDINKSINACNKLLEIGIKDNNLAYEHLKKLIANKLFSESLFDDFADKIHSLIKDVSKRKYFELNLKSKDDIIRPSGRFSQSRLHRKTMSNHKILSDKQKAAIALDNKYLVAELNILLFKKDYDEIIRVRDNIFYSDSICDVPVSVERITAKAYLGLGDTNKAIESIENARAEKGRQAYLHKDIAEIYESIGKNDLAILYYYKYCLEAPDKKMINNTLLKLIELESSNDSLCKDYLNLYFLIQENNNWSIKQSKRDLKKQYDFGDGKEYNELLKELIYYWEMYIEENDDVKIYSGYVEKIGENKKFGFISYYDDDNLSNSIYFKMPKKMKVELNYTVRFTIEKSYDKVKSEYSKAAYII